MATPQRGKKAEEQEFLPREKFFRDIDAFADWLTKTSSKAVTILSERLSDTVVHTKREVRDFHDFTFLVERCQKKTGSGNVCTVWHHPGKEFQDGLKPVLEVWWPLKLNEDCTERWYERGRGWRLKIRALIAWKTNLNSRAA
jgi:hypothetical protein